MNPGETHYWTNNMNVILLMAGIGSRAREITNGLPKCLLEINGAPILSRNIAAFNEVDASLVRCHVLGYRAEEVKKYLPRGDLTVCNPFYKMTNSSASLWFARKYLAGDVIVMNGDVCTSAGLLRKVIDLPSGNYIFVDTAKPCRDPVFNPSAIPGWVGEYIGIYRLNTYGSDAMMHQINRFMKEERFGEYHEAAVSTLLRDNFPLSIRDVAGESWVEIDSPEDLVNANRIFP